MTEKQEQDPELLDDENEGTGGDEHYDGKAVESTEYDHSEFELPEDFEINNGDDEE